MTRREMTGQMDRAEEVIIEERKECRNNELQRTENGRRQHEMKYNKMNMFNLRMISDEIQE